MVNLRHFPSGVWAGVEVEHTPFYGKKSLFFGRMSRFEADVKSGCHLCWRFEHVLLGATAPAFFDSQDSCFAKLAILIDELLWRTRQLCVTLEVVPGDVTFATFLRCKYSGRFCLLVDVEVPQVELGGFALKAVPSVLFGVGEHEGSVYTAKLEAMGRTRWKEYADDREVP